MKSHFFKLKLTITLFYSLFCMQLNATNFENDYDNQSIEFQTEDEKIYTSPENIHITQTGIYLCFGEDFIPVQQIAFDSEGLYVSFSDKLKPIDAWYCRTCRWHNPCFAKHCGRCGRSEEECN